ALLPGPTRTPFFREAGMERTHVGRLPKPSAARTARRAVDALALGRPEVVTGVQGAAMVAVARALPPARPGRVPRLVLRARPALARGAPHVVVPAAVAVDLVGPVAP